LQDALSGRHRIEHGLAMVSALLGLRPAPGQIVPGSYHLSGGSVRLAWMMVAFGLVCVPRLAMAGTLSWSQAFVAERDTMLFMGSDGTLLRAPVSLATRETLWAPRRSQHLVRVRVSPDGTRLAWLSRDSDSDTTRLWIHDQRGTTLHLRYFAFESNRYGYQHSEPDVPSIEDEGADGGRLVQANALMRRFPSNTLEWSADSRSVIVGFDGGIAALPLEGGSRDGVTYVAAIGLEALHPSAVLLVDAIVLGQPSEYPPLRQFELDDLLSGTQAFNVQEGRRVSRARVRYLVRPTRGEWRLCPASDLAKPPLRAASPGTVWWADGSSVRAVHADTCGSHEEIRASSKIVWLRYDERRRSLLWASGREVLQRSEDGGRESRVIDAGSTIRAVLQSGTSHTVALVTKDSLIVWDPAAANVRSYHLGGLEPCALFEGPEDRLVVRVNCGTGLPRRLARADSASRRLVEIATPAVREGVFHALGSGAWILLYDPAAIPSRTIHAYEIRNGTWTAIQNPGISGWEPFQRKDPAGVSEPDHGDR
jgi:hypothetical protein